MTAITILGSGRVASGLAAKLANAGHGITIGSRDPDGAAQRWKGPKVSFAPPADGVAKAAIVINATPGDSSLERLSALAEVLAGKILIDVSNATTHGANGMPGGLAYPDSSLGERLQAALPGTRVVKTLNTMLFTVMTDPKSLGTPPTAFLSGDDADAKRVVAALLGDLGWPAGWIEDLGGIATARAPEAFILLVPSIIRAHGFKPFAFSLAR